MGNPPMPREHHRIFLHRVLRIVRLSRAAGGITTEDLVGHFQAGPDRVRAALDVLNDAKFISCRSLPSIRRNVTSEIRWFSAPMPVEGAARAFGEALDAFIERRQGVKQ